MSARRSTRASNDRVESLAPNLAHVLAVIALAVFAAIHFRAGAGRVAPSSGDASDSKSVSAGFAIPTEKMASASASLGSHPAGRKLTVDDLILGCSPLAGIYASSTPERATETVRAALDAGITRFDTAPHYGLGLSERRLGDALRECGADMSKTRVYTKVGRVMKPKDEVTASEKESAVEWGNVPGDPGCIFPDAPVDVLPVLDYTGPGFRRSHADSLARLRLGSVDGLRIHDAEDEARYAQANAGGGVAELVKLRDDERAIREVSLGMNDAAFVRRMLEDKPPGTFDSVMMAGAWNLLDQDGGDVLWECERRGVAVHNAGIFASGLLVGGSHYKYAPAPPDIVARTERWRALASKHGVPLPAVAIAFACAPRVVKGCAVGVKSPEEVAQSVAWLADANAVPAQLWVDAKELGLLAPDVPTPSPA